MLENDKSKSKNRPAAVLASGLVALAGCGKDPSVASRSAAAFREAHKKGATFEGAAGSHGGHSASTPGEGEAGMAGMKMGGEDQAGMAGMKMGGKDQGGMAGMKMGGKDQGGMAGMKMGGKNPAAGPPAVAAPVAASPGQPARTLSSDPLDSPAATSVLDAQRSAAMAEEMSGGTSGMSGMNGMGGHETGTYRQVDAGRGLGAHEGSEKRPPERRKG